MYLGEPKAYAGKSQPRSLQYLDLINAAAVACPLLGQRGQVYQDISGGHTLLRGQGRRSARFRVGGHRTPKPVRAHRWQWGLSRVGLRDPELDGRTGTAQGEVDRAHRLRSVKIKNNADAALQITQFRVSEVLHRTPPGGRVTVVGQAHLVRILSFVFALRIEVPSVGDGQLLGFG